MEFLVDNLASQMHPRGKYHPKQDTTRSLHLAPGRLMRHLYVMLPACNTTTVADFQSSKTRIASCMQAPLLVTTNVDRFPAMPPKSRSGESKRSSARTAALCFVLPDFCYRLPSPPRSDLSPTKSQGSWWLPISDADLVVCRYSEPLAEPPNSLTEWQAYSLLALSIPQGISPLLNLPATDECSRTSAQPAPSARQRRGSRVV